MTVIEQIFARRREVGLPGVHDLAGAIDEVGSVRDERCEENVAWQEAWRIDAYATRFVDAGKFQIVRCALRVCSRFGCCIFVGSFPLLLMTQQSLATMAQADPEQSYDVRRFRPNILLDCATGDDLPERAWEGRTLKIGTATLKLELNCPRCVMTTHGFADLPKDPGIMRSLVKHAHGELGIYASVVEPGDVKVGDTIEFSQ